MIPSIEVKHLSKSFGEKQALKDISFQVESGEVFGLLGHNGAGKSTTMDCILGLTKMDQGEVSVLSMNPKKQRSKLFEKVGVQLQASSYAEAIRVGEICEEMKCLYQNAADSDELLEEFGLSDKKNQPVNKLSGGERQKLSVLLALIPQPELVFLDELTTGLDVLARHEVWNILVGLKKKGMTIFLTSHYMDEVETLCDRICIIKQGEIIASGTVSEVIESSPFDRLEDAYLWYNDPTYTRKGGTINE